MTAVVLDWSSESFCALSLPQDSWEAWCKEQICQGSHSARTCRRGTACSARCDNGGGCLNAEIGSDGRQVKGELSAPATRLQQTWLCAQVCPCATPQGTEPVQYAATPHSCPAGTKHNCYSHSPLRGLSRHHKTSTWLPADVLPASSESAPALLKHQTIHTQIQTWNSFAAACWTLAWPATQAAAMHHHSRTDTEPGPQMQVRSHGCMSTHDTSVVTLTAARHLLAHVLGTGEKSPPEVGQRVLCQEGGPAT